MSGPMMTSPEVAPDRRPRLSLMSRNTELAKNLAFVARYSLRTARAVLPPRISI